MAQIYRVRQLSYCPVPFRSLGKLKQEGYQHNSDQVKNASGNPVLGKKLKVNKYHVDHNGYKCVHKSFGYFQNCAGIFVGKHSRDKKE